MLVFLRGGVLALLCACLGLAAPAVAGERVTLGSGWLMTNDALGDGLDRWRSASTTLSVMRGPEGTSTRPEAPGTLMEYRFSNRILAPDNTVLPVPGDRRYAGIVSFGAFTHFARQGFEVSLGAEVVAVGPGTGVFAAQSFVHDLFGVTPPSALVEATQFANALYPAAAVEVARPFALGERLALRPFVEGRAGDETFLRAGADLLFGSAFTGGVTVRDATTGLLYQTLEDSPDPGFSFLIGGDVTSTFESVWLPDTAYLLEPAYLRARAGLHAQTRHLGLFYGLAWSGREFAAQPSGQIIGAVQLQIRF